MVKESRTKENPIEWLREPNDVGVKYLAMRDLIEADPKELVAAKKKAHTEGPIARCASENEKRRILGETRSRILSEI